MATKDQYEFFRSLYEDEERTTLELEGRAKVYLSIISAFLAVVFLKADEVSRSAGTLGIPWWGILVEAVILGGSILCVVLSLRIRRFEAVNDGIEIIENYGDAQPTDAEFFDERIADYAVASSRNREVNNSMARILSWAGWLLVAGMIFLLALIVIAFLK